MNSYVQPSPPPTPHQAYSNCAVCSHKCHQYGRVITYCNHALRMDKTWVKAHYLKGKALHSLSSLEDAKRSLKEAQRLTPNDRMITKALDNLNKYVFLYIIFKMLFHFLIIFFNCPLPLPPEPWKTIVGLRGTSAVKCSPSQAQSQNPPPPAGL